jgi:hypothetical protein
MYRSQSGGYLSCLCGKSVPQCTPRLVQLGLRVAQAATNHGGNFAMLKTMDIMKEEEMPIARRQSGHGAIEGYAVDNASLPPITSAKTAPNVFLRNVGH